MKVLVTGASGFVGSALLRHLVSQNDEVRVLLRQTSKQEFLEGLPVKRVFGDLRNPQSLKQAVLGVEGVYHVAGVVHARTEDEYVQGNVKGTENLLNAVAEYQPGLQRFLHVSSLAAAGPAPSLRPRREGEDGEPVSIYGRSKREAEVLVQNFSRRFAVSIVRPPVVYGPRDPNFLTSVKIISNSILPVLKGESETRHKYFSTVHVDDLCRGLIRVMKEGSGSGDVFYVSGDEIVTYEEGMRVIADALGKRPIRVPVPRVLVKGVGAALGVAQSVMKRSFPLNPDKVKELMPDYWICSNEKMKKELRFFPEVSFEAGMKETVAWYRKHGWV